MYFLHNYAINNLNVHDIRFYILYDIKWLGSIFICSNLYSFKIFASNSWSKLMKISQELGRSCHSVCDLHIKSELVAAKKTFILHHVIMKNKYKRKNIDIETNWIRTCQGKDIKLLWNAKTDTIISQEWGLDLIGIFFIVLLKIQLKLSLFH